MANDDVPPVEDGTEEILTAAEDVDGDSPIARMRAENDILSEAVDYVAAWSEAGEVSNANTNALADALSGEFAHYTKTDIKEEFNDVFVDNGGGSDGIPFDELIEERLDEVKIVTTTDAKRGLVWRWHFTDGVQLETETSKDDQRKHYDWVSWREDYFEALLSVGQGERIAPPRQEHRDSADWKEWLSDIVLENAQIVEHVGPRTEAVELLKDFVNRQTAFAKVRDMRDRQGIWMDSPPVDPDEEAATDGGGPCEIRIPTQAVKRICDQAGIETRALQIELDAREHTLPDVSGVSGFEYVDGQRVSFWSVTADFAEPAEFIEEPETPAEQVAREQEEAAEEARTDVGAVDGESDEDDVQETDDADEGTEAVQDDENDEDDVQETDDAPTPPPDEPVSDEELDDYVGDFDTGITGGFGVDPDADEDGEEGE